MMIRLYLLSAVSPVGEQWRHIPYTTDQERFTAANALRVAGWLRITFH